MQLKLNNHQEKKKKTEPPGAGSIELNIFNLAPTPIKLPVHLESILKSKQLSKHKFPINKKTELFRRKFFPQSTVDDWNDWKWQVRNRVRKIEQLQSMIQLSQDERESVVKRTGNLPIAITPYYLSLFDPENCKQPIRMTHLPDGGEFIITQSNMYDNISPR